MVEAERTNRDLSTPFLYREVITYRDVDSAGQKRTTRSSTYEVTFVEGEPFHRLVELDGQPVPAEVEEQELRRMEEVARYRSITPLEERRKRSVASEGKRFKIDSRYALEWGDAVYEGEAEIDGRKSWVVHTRPKKRAPKPKNRNQWTLSQECRFWIDQETAHPLKMESTQLYDWEGIKKGSRTLVEYRAVDDVWLMSRILTSNAQSLGRRNETEQAYSRYRKFQSDTVIHYSGTAAKP